MDQYLIFLLLGLANGAVYAALALALVVTYRSSGVLNFATGSMALLGGYFYASFRKGELLTPLPFAPKAVSLGGSDLGFWPSLVLSVAICALIGLVLYVLVFRPLRAAPPVAKAVASLGIMLLFTALITWRVGTTAVPVKPIFPSTTWTIGTVRITQDRVWFAVTIVAITLVLSAIYRFTRFGMITRAAAETEKGAFVSGISPDRIAAINWMIGSAVAAVAGVLIAPIVPLTPIGFTFFIVPALAAAVMGRFVHMIPAVLGGLAIGMIQSVATYMQQYDWMPDKGTAELVPLILILFVLVVRGRPLPTRGTAIEQLLGRAPRPRSILIPAVVGGVAAVIGLFALQSSWRAGLITTFIIGTIALSLVVVTGYAGQVSLAQLTLAGVAGFIVGPLTANWGIPFPIAPILAALLATAVGVVVGLPALRVRGLLVAVVTLSLATAIEALWFRNPDYVGTSGVNVDGPYLFGLDLRSRVGTDYPRVQFGLLALAVLVGVAVSVAKLRTSTLGSQMLAVRANERSAAGAGIPVVRVKLTAFAIAAFIAGLGGSMLAYFQGNVTFEAYTTFIGLVLFSTVYVAGITSVSGGITSGVMAAGGVLVVVVNQWVKLGDVYNVLAGVLVVFTVIMNPEGVVGPIHAKLDERRRKGVPEAALPAEGKGDLVPMEPVAGGEVVLSVNDVRVRYGGVVAIDDVSLEARKGTIVGLIGPNGAGKTTLVDAITGFAAYTGKVTVMGRDLTGLSPHKRAWASLGRTFQQLQLYDDLSVTENVVVGRAAAQGRSPRDLDEVLAMLDLTALADRPVGELSQGHRQLVSIARALIGNPDLLLLDEPAGGLDSGESQWLGQRLRAIRDNGVTIFLIDHDMHLVLNLCDSIYVLNFGKVIAQGTPTQIRADRAVADAYLGSTHAEAASS